ncbi:MAG: hypothetical protein AAFX51_12680 [Cyanobacteria bacterium J06636_28]
MGLEGLPLNQQRQNYCLMAPLPLLLFSVNRPEKAKDVEFAARTVDYGAPMTPAPSPLTFKEADILHFKLRLVYENIMYKYFIKRISPQEVR